MKKIINVGSDFSGVGAFNQALKRLKINYNEVFACDMDKYARQTYIYNFGEPAYYPENVYDRKIPKEPLQIYMTSPPCQAFSLAGKRKGEGDNRGVLFYNSHEFITKNKPRYFIFENVKGLLSDDGGKTFARWLDLLGGKSVNGNPIIFPHEESTPYHVYHQVLNAKNYGVPQNRERIFIIGIRDDCDNNFTFPKPFHLEKRLKDILETEVDEKYFLSDKMISGFIKHSDNCKEKGSGFKFEPKKIESIGNCITARCFKMGIDDNYIVETKIGAIRGRNPQNPLSRVSGLPTEQMLEINENGTSNALTTVQKDNVVVYDLTNDFREDTPREYSEFSPALRSSRSGLATNTQQRIRRLTPKECFRLMDFNADMIEKTLNSKQNLYFQFIYSKFDINKKETLWNVKLKTVKEQLIQENLETFVYCTTKERQKLELLTNAQKEKTEKPQNVNFVIEKLVDMEQKECVINITKWTDFTETLYISKKYEASPVVVVILGTLKEGKYIEELWKITLEENLQIKKLYTTLILLKQIMQSEIYTYAKTEANTPRYIASIINYEKELGRLQLSFLKMEFTKQIVSDSMLYKQAGNSIVVNCLVELISKLNL
jgi:DNA (cytosine-5)-methyltransferase 1